jgi:hypothetical protein
MTRTDTQQRRCAGDARKTSKMRYQPPIWNQVPQLRDASLSHGAVLFWSMKPQTGTGKTHAAYFPADKDKFVAGSHIIERVKKSSRSISPAKIQLSASQMASPASTGYAQLRLAESEGVNDSKTA